MPSRKPTKSTKRNRSKSPRTKTVRSRSPKSSSPSPKRKTRARVLPTRGILSFGVDKLTLNNLVHAQGINWSFGNLYAGWLTMTGIKTINEINEATGELKEIHSYFAGNIWPVHNDGNYTPIQLSAEQLFKQFVLPEFCQGDLDPDYVKNSIGYSTDIFILFYPVELTQTTRTGIHTTTGFYSVGFATGYKLDKYDPPIVDGFYVDIICVLPKDNNFNQHSGNMLLDLVERIMYGVGMNEIHLSALPTVLTYYPRLGYYHRKSCSTEPDLKDFSEGILKKIQTKTLPKTNELALEDPDILERMIDLSLKKYGSKHGKCNPVKQIIDEKEIMKSRDEIKYDLINRGCWDSGHRMIKCLQKERPANYYNPYRHLLNVFPQPTLPSSRK